MRPAAEAPTRRRQPAFALFTLTMVYAMLVAVLVGLAGPLRMVFAQYEIDVPELCRLAIAAGAWLSTPVGAIAALGVLALLLLLCGRLVPPARRSRATWTAAILLMLGTCTVLVGVWVPTSKLAAALERGAAPR